MTQPAPIGWTQTANALTRTIQRTDFVEALATMVEIGRLAQEANHHPDLSLRSYRFLDVSLSTHSAGNTVTSKDFALAKRINDLDENVVRLTRIDLLRRYVS